MKLTRHNGRSGKNGAYNPKHNDRRFNVENSDHIDLERAKRNVYWDCYQGFHFPSDQSQEEQISYSFEQVEQAFYNEQYYDFCEAQHERNRKSGHSNRDRTPKDLWGDKKTCPEESLIQIGTMEQSVPPEVLAEIAAEFFTEFDRRFGKHIHILDWALHLDEATPHIHERHVFDCENRYGEIAPQQEKALEALGFDLPDPDGKPSKLNNRKKTFDAACRALLFDICAEHGLHLDHEPEYGGRAYLEKQDYILMKQREKLAELTMKVDDLEGLIADVSEAAYDKAVVQVAKTVQNETTEANIVEIEKYKVLLASSDKVSEKYRNVLTNVMDIIIRRIRKAVGTVAEKVIISLNDPKKREQNLNDIQAKTRESVLRLLSQKTAEADQANSAKNGPVHRLEKHIR